MEKDIVVFKAISSTEDDGFYYREASKIEADNGVSASFMDGETEDANISRDFNDVYQIQYLIERANQLGLEGKTVAIEHLDIPWSEFY